MKITSRITEAEGSWNFIKDTARQATKCALSPFINLAVAKFQDVYGSNTWELAEAFYKLARDYIEFRPDPAIAERRINVGILLHAIMREHPELVEAFKLQDLLEQYPASRVLDKAAGDCDDKVMFLATLLMVAGFPVRLVGAVHLPSLSPEQQAKFSSARGTERINYINHVLLEFKYKGQWVAADPSSDMPLGKIPDTVIPVAVYLIKLHTRRMGDMVASENVKGLPVYQLSVGADISEKDLKQYKTMYQVFSTVEAVGREGRKATEQIARQKGFYYLLVSRGPVIAQALKNPVTWLITATASGLALAVGFGLGAMVGGVKR